MNPFPDARGRKYIFTFTHTEWKALEEASKPFLSNRVLRNPRVVSVNVCQLPKSGIRVQYRTYRRPLRELQGQQRERQLESKHSLQNSSYDQGVKKL